MSFKGQEANAYLVHLLTVLKRRQKHGHENVGHVKQLLCFD